MITREEMVTVLKAWGRWQRTAKNPNLYYAKSQYETPLQKKRNVSPVYFDQRAEQLDYLITQHFNAEEIYILELTYVENKINTVIADMLHCCPKTLITTRNEIIASLRGLYTCIR